MKITLYAGSIPILSASAPNAGAASPPTINETPITSEEAIPASFGAALCAMIILTGIVDESVRTPRSSIAREITLEVWRKANSSGV